MSVALSEAREPGLPAPAADARPRHDGWRAYLVVAAMLAPICVPSGPGQVAAIDVVNLVAIVLFALFVMAPGRQPLRAPLLAPAMLVAVGSLVATLWAPSAGIAALSLLQDAYLFAWFLVVVNLIRTPRDLRAVRVAWVCTAVAVSLGALGQLLVHTGGSLGTLLVLHGLRPAATLYNPNMLADYLVISVFVALSLLAEVPRVPLVLAIGTLGLALLATKSNGGMVVFAAGAMVWCVVAVATGPQRRHGRLLALAAIAVSLVGVVAWLNLEWGLGGGAVQALSDHTFVGRMQHSSQSRLHIWDQLQRSYARSPLGIGPGNSGALTLGIAERERPDSYRSKEAHNDYLAYAIERGPLAVAGLLVLTVAAFLHVLGYWRSASHRGRRPPRRVAWWTTAMAAALTASALHSTVIEKLHFRHFWLFLALVCGSSIMAAERAVSSAKEAA